MGHGVAVTRLQMLDAMAAIANDGWLMQPMIVSRLQEHDGRWSNVTRRSAFAKSSAKPRANR